MTATLYTAAASGGKTTLMQGKILALKAREPMARVWVLAATERQIQMFRAGLAARAGRTTLFNIDYFNFYSLYQRVLAAGGRPQRSLSETARRALVRSVVRDRPDSVFAPIADTAGLARILDGFFVELKQNLVSPDDFALAAHPSSPKQRDLAALYADYSRRLQDHDLVDRDGEGWVALDVLDNQPSLFKPGNHHQIDLLVVDGYDQFQRVQAKLVAALAGRAMHTHITLTQPDDRPGIGKRFTQARARLERAFDEAAVPFAVSRVPDFLDDRPAPLRYLSAQMMRPQPTEPAPHASSVHAALALCEAPSPAEETRLVLAQVKRVLLNGEAPDGILIALHAWHDYAPHFRAQADAFGVPLTFHRAEPLMHNPAVASLMAALALPGADYPRRDLLDVLRSPYLKLPALDADAVSALEALSLRDLVTGGRSRWLDMLDREARRAPQNALTEEIDVVLRPPAPGADAASLRPALEALFLLLEGRSRDTFSGHSAWLGSLVGIDPAAPADTDDDAQPDEGASAAGLRIFDGIRAADDDGLIRRDLHAMQQFFAALRGLAEAISLTDGLVGSVLIPRKTFLRDLRAVLLADAPGGAGGRDGSVLVTTLNDARGLPHQHVFMTGLSEGLFPAPAPTDPLLLDSERAALNARGIPVTVQAERSDDIGLFYEVLGQTGRTLMLTRPTAKDGSLWMPSPIWTAVVRLFPDLPVSRVRTGVLPDASECHTPALVAASLSATGGNHPAGAWLLGAHAALAARIRAGWQADIARVRRKRSAYTGILNARWAQDAVRARLHDGYVWSASQLAALGTCGFRFFAARVLGLASLVEPEAGMQPYDRGSIAHAILERTYAEWAGSGRAIQPEFADEAADAARRQAAAVLASAPEVYGFRRGAAWEADARAIADAVAALVRADFTGGLKNLARFSPVRVTDGQEIAFGPEGQPVRIVLDDDLAVALRGSIDRIDTAPAANGARLIVDYKWRTVPSPDEYERGRGFQMMAYMLAAREIFGDGEIAGTFVSIVEGKTERDLLWLDAVPDRLAGEKGHAPLDADHGRAVLARNIRQAREGNFASEANGMEQGRCASACDFSRLCRIGIMARRGDA
jgi:ATP-dependent helicase/nuclease subunit B